MAILFSAVTVSDGKNEVEFLVGGIPRSCDDFEYYTAFENFTDRIEDETELIVHADAYFYGEGEIFNATPEELAYFMKRIQDDDRFLQGHCDHVGKSDFTSLWHPAELYEMEM